MEIKTTLVVTIDEFDCVWITETHDSACKRIADTFGFNHNMVQIIDDESHTPSYNGSLIEECHILVKGIEYSVGFDYKNGDNHIMVW